jgi:hypothetical protein
MAIMAKRKVAQVKTLIGKTIVACKKDGTLISGKLVSVKGNRLYVQPKGKHVRTKGLLLPLLLTDLAAVGAGYGGYGGYDGVPYGYGGVPYGYGGAYGGLYGPAGGIYDAPYGGGLFF